MKLYCLSGHPNRPCFILKFKQTTIMFDCGLDISPLMHFLPSSPVPSGSLSKLPGWTARDTTVGTKLEQELKECNGQIFIDGTPEFGIPETNMVDMSEVDIILMSNYHCVLALPFITQYTSFKGRVYATEPTLHLSRLLMEEMVAYIDSTPRVNTTTRWKQYMHLLPPPLKDLVNPITWKKCYNKHDIQTSLKKIHTVGFDEKINIFGGLEITAISSGFSIGSANWIIKSHHEKIAYVSGSSTLTTHPRPMSTLPLKNSDILILSGLTQTPTANPDQKIGEFCYNTEVTLRNGGNVLVPCYPCGVIYDLIECLSGHLDNRGLGQVPLYFINPVADSSLAYSNIYAEWLSKTKQNKVYLPEFPFPHADLVVSNRLKHFKSIHDGFENEMRTPCIVFTGHPSLRFGDVVHFMQMWGNSASNIVIFTEPDFPYLEALTPYQPLAMKVSYCPIDTSLSFSQANKLIRELKPLHIVAAEGYTSPPPLLAHRSELKLTVDCDLITYKHNQILSMPIKRKYEQIHLDPQLAAMLMPTEIKPGVAVTMVSGNLEQQDHRYTYKVLEADNKADIKPPKLQKRESRRPTYAFGSLDVHEFADKLRKQGISDVKVEESQGGYIVHLASEDTLIQVEEGATHILCQGNEKLRIQLKDTLLQCLRKL